jgi:pimeloyl-ACP methyl ester carboxylesterase
MNIVSPLIFLTVLMSRAEDAGLGHMLDFPKNETTGSAASAFKGEQQISAVPQDRFFDSNGVRIRYVEQGQGPPVVLIHGYTGNLERHWINPGVFANLANDYRVIAIDCRGHGKSGKPTNPRAYGAEMGKDIIRLLDHLKIRRAHIVGFSMGAIIAGHLLTTNADRFLSATLVGHPAVRTWTAADEQEAEASARDLESDTPFRSLILGVWPSDAPPPSEDEIRKRSQAMVAVNDPKALAAYHRGRSALVAPDAKIGRVRTPTLGIIGSADPSLTGMQELRKAMPALSLVVVEGAAHGGERGVLRHPQFLPTLREFLAARR